MSESPTPDALDDDLDALLSASEGLVARADVVGNLSRLVEVLAARLQADDGSVLLLDHPDRPAWVVAATDELAQPQIPLDVERHPEIREVIRTHEPLVVVDVDRDPLFDGVRAYLQARTLGSTVIFPVRSADEVTAALRLRARAKRPHPLTARELRLGRIFANTAGCCCGTRDCCSL